jgi:F-type H+-transporting ATPase subunit b
VAREQIIKEAREKADVETGKMIAEAKREILQQREEALNAVREEAAKVALAVAEKILRRELSGEERQQEYIEKLVDETKEEMQANRE